MTRSALISSATTGEGRGRRPPPIAASGAFDWVRRRFFADWQNAVVSILIAAALILWLPSVFRWAVTDAIWSTTDPDTCRAALGACWAVVPEKYRVILFGTYPPDERWRGGLVIAIVIALAVISSLRRFWSLKLFALWIVAAFAVLLLMGGGALGLTPVGTHDWGGLPLTFILFIGTVVGGLPLAVLLALGRQSGLPVIKAFCVAVIEIVRGIPLVAVLFMALVMFPLFVPAEFTVDKLLRAQIAMMVFFAAYAAEIVRGGLQAIPRGQYEAASAIGLTYWQSRRKIVLPQALAIVLPALMNDIIRAFKNTTFVSIIGLFDILGATKAALQDLRWISYAPEAYIFIFALYFVFCFSMSKYSEGLEQELAQGRRY